MKNVLLVFALTLISSVSFAGECSNGVCSLPVKPLRKVVTVTREVIVAPVRVVAAIVAPRTVSSNVCSDGCGNTTKEVVKHQPLRRRLVSRSSSTSVGCDCGCK